MLHKEKKFLNIDTVFLIFFLLNITKEKYITPPWTLNRLYLNGFMIFIFPWEVLKRI